jgi:hypothetical protein
MRIVSEFRSLLFVQNSFPEEEMEKGMIELAWQKVYPSATKAVPRPEREFVKCPN